MNAKISKLIKNLNTYQDIADALKAYSDALDDITDIANGLDSIMTDWESDTALLARMEPYYQKLMEMGKD